MELVEVLFDPDKANIRNRVVHGNLLEIESKTSEAMMSAYSGANRAITEDPYMPSNIANNCIAALVAIDQEASHFGVATADLAWATSLMLTDTEIDFGRNLHLDLLEVQPKKFESAVTQLMDCMCPGFRQLFMLGFVGWMQTMDHFSTSASKPTTTIPQFLSLALVFETLYRLTVHLLGHSVVQRSFTRATGFLHCQYRMLDARPDGICKALILDEILADVPAPQREAADECFRLAIKARNALAHGALVTVDLRTAEGLGHILFKSIHQLLAVMEKKK